MKKLISVSILLLMTNLFCSKQNDTIKNQDVKNPEIKKEVIEPEFGKILDSLNVKGSILIYDPKEKIFYSNDFVRAGTGKLPASTFKIPNSIIALETKIIESDTTVFKWDGKKRNLKIWEKDLTFKEAFRFSCVPCYQEIARKVGTERMKEYLTLLKYPGMIVDSATIDNFWLQGDSKISQFQQIDFLERFYDFKLPISERTDRIMREILKFETSDNYILSGKTGWTMRNGEDIGWFVGYIETKENLYFFATNIEPAKNSDLDKFPEIRILATKRAFAKMGIAM
ncbi:MAG TPA: class D beta-lactamase [Ignavibacteria bacterium]|nr:class D beta-lactamase [Ignavibacteria bacterium]